MRILLVHNHYKHHGGEDSVFDEEKSLLQKHGHHVICYQIHNDEIDTLSPVKLAFRTLWSFKTVTTLSSIIKTERPDIIHVHNTFPLISPSLYWTASKHNIPVVQTIHNFRLFCLQAMFLRDNSVCEDCLGHIPIRGIFHKCYRNSMLASTVTASMLAFHRAIGTYKNKINSYIALNDFCRNKLIEGNIPAEHIYVKPNFVDINIPLATTRCSNPLFVGRLSPEKGLHNLVSALTSTLTTSIDIVGSGPLFDELSTQSKLNMLGSLPPSDVYEKMRHAPFLIMPSIWYENFPRTLVESFALGTPVIASRIGALAEIIDDNVTGLLFDPGSAEDLHDKINWALNNPDKMQIMGANARNEYLEKYTSKINYQTLLDIYTKTIN